MNALPFHVIEKLQALPPEDLHKVLQFVETLAPAHPAAPERPRLRGRFSHLGVHLSAEAIAGARREAWANFPRDLPPTTQP